MAKVLHVPHDLSLEILREATHCIKQGGTLAVSTESFYALAAGVMHREAVERVAAMKGARDAKPILVLISHPEQLSSLVSTLPSGADCLMKQFWPGPLTLVLPAAPDLPTALSCGTETIGVRQPGDTRLLTLLAETGPLTGTSANRSGMAPTQTAEELEREFGSELDLILDSGPSPGGMPSTLVNLVGEIRILRKGPIAYDALQKALSVVGLTLID